MAGTLDSGLSSPGLSFSLGYRVVFLGKTLYFQRRQIVKETWQQMQGGYLGGISNK